MRNMPSAVVVEVFGLTLNTGREMFVALLDSSSE